MNLGMIKARARRLAGSPTTSRWTESDMTDFANDASLQLAMALDFPSATRIIRSLQQPSQPTLAVNGAAGTTTNIYAIVEVAETGGGDSIPSPNAQVTNAPNALSVANSVSVTFSANPGTTYKVLRQVLGVDAFPMYLATLVATAASMTVVDQGQYKPQSYRITRGNEYQLPDLIKILGVSIVSADGSVQQLVPTEIAWQKGVANETWDQSSGTIVGYPQFTSQWDAQEPEPYPVISPTSGRVTVTSPWQNTTYGNQRAMYALRGGYLIIMPATAAQQSYQIIIDMIPRPPVMRQNADLSIFPDGCIDALAFKMRSYMAISDDDSRDTDFEQRFENECTKLRITYVDTIQADKPNGIVMLPLRAQMREWPV